MYTTLVQFGTISIMLGYKSETWHCWIADEECNGGSKVFFIWKDIFYDNSYEHPKCKIWFWIHLILLIIVTSKVSNYTLEVPAAPKDVSGCYPQKKKQHMSSLFPFSNTLLVGALPSWRLHFMSSLLTDSFNYRNINFIFLPSSINMRR